jgi:single-strand DNA-binding protein
MQRLVIKGNVGQEPELKTVSGGQTLCKFSVAVNESFTKKDGTKQESTTWFNVTVWGKAAERTAARVKKGSRVIVEGKVKLNTFEGKDGTQKASLEVTALSVDTLEKFQREDGADAGGRDAGMEPDYDNSSDDAPF